jgi:hypothetical protein
MSDIFKSNKNKNIKEILKTCTFHNRDVEAFCIDCNYFICASCTLISNNPHKLHSINSLNETIIYLRNLISDNFNYMKKEHTEEKLLSLKEVKIQLQSETTEIIQKINSIFEEIIQSVKERHEYLVHSIKNNYEKQISILREQEEKWLNRECMQVKLLEFAANPEDNTLLCNSEFIIECMKELSIVSNELNNIHKLSVYREFDLNLNIANKNPNNNMNNMNNTVIIHSDYNNSNNSNNRNQQQYRNITSTPKGYKHKTKTNKTEYNDYKDSDHSIDELLVVINSLIVFKEPAIIEFKS